MKRTALFSALFIISISAWASFASAGLIISGDHPSTMWDDCDGVLECQSAVFGEPVDGEYPITIKGNQFDHYTTGEPETRGHLIGDFNVDGDPTLKIISSIDNDTSFDWTAYHVNVYMGVEFTLSGVNVSNPGWTTTSYTPTAVWDSGLGKYVAQIDYSGGTPVTHDPVGTLDFSYKMTFATSSPQYCIELVPVPEPSVIMTLLAGVFGLVVWRRLRA
jgi:hypothetical protein